jgi:hypothetical protein
MASPSSLIPTIRVELELLGRAIFLRAAGCAGFFFGFFTIAAELLPSPFFSPPRLSTLSTRRHGVAPASSRPHEQSRRPGQHEHESA